ncbi:MAG: PAS domain-containing protein [Burkholderiales bacterium]|nr:PAS domain-containing protein [Burkholderiales bacterium]
MTNRKKTAAKKITPKSAAAQPPGQTIEDIAADETAAPDEAGFPIVGIGASAGGLAAFETFFSAIPNTSGSGIAYIIVQHLAPNHKSMLTELIGRYTRMQVLEVEHGMVVKPDCIYIIPPNHDMAFLNGTLQLLEPAAPRGQRLPIDFFFRSLAQDQHARAIGIVLSGTGSDGSQGVRAIKGEGGMVMAQSFDSTEYDGMPRSAVATGMVDFVLPPEDMPAQLMAYVGHAFIRIRSAAKSSGLKVDEGLKKIFVLLRAQTGHDFSRYKLNTINRRIERRMAVQQLEQVNDYVQYLRRNPAELEALFRDLLIGVTNFFRDPEAFKALEEEAIVRLLSNKPVGAAIRVWVPGCSTGEEAYSIAILLQERMDALKANFKLLVFATDIDSRAIEHARMGIYTASIAADISSERLKRYFTEEPGGGFYRINKFIRDMLVFSEQDVIKDPPFSRIDLISCRNLLIYMGPELHKKLIPLFHYALNPGGILFLGSSESIGDHLDLFATLNRSAKLYQRKDEGIPLRQSLSRFLPALSEDGTVQRTTRKSADNSAAQLRELTERTLLQYYAAAGALVNERGDILYLHGRTGQYLESAAGEAGLNILKMARQGLRPALTTALHKAAAKKETVSQSGLRVKTNGDFSSVDLTVQPVAAAKAADQPLFLVILAPAAQPFAAGAAAAEAGAADSPKKINAQVTALQQELRDKEEYLQTSTEELETTNEELKSANEEMQSINEEMQSTNEELETSKEELQSVNEELATVNAELQGKVVDLSQANNDMNNLLAGTGVGTIFVDHQLSIKRFTPAITQVINLILTDVGRPVGDIVSNLTGYNHLVEDVQQVLDNLVPKEIEVETKLGKWFLLRIRPYRTLENVIEGAVITFFDISDMKKARDALRESDSLRRLAVVMSDSRDAILVQDLEGKILAWNPGASRLYGWSEAEALAMNIRQLIPQAGQEEALAVIQQLGRAEILQPYRMERITKDGSIVRVALTATALVNASGDVYAVATTERKDV